MADRQQRTIVVMIDGLDLDYWDVTRPPYLHRMATEGFFKRGRCVFPSLTNANNVSIACACWPEVHGVTTNCYFDEASGSAKFLEDASFLCTHTIFEKAAANGIRSALLTCKSKTTKILGSGVDLVVAAEEPSREVVRRFGSPPPMYSADINYWLCQVGLDTLERRPEVGLLYLHTTDYPMHMWPPGAPQSEAHLLALDGYIEQMRTAAPDAALIVTADHGMNCKTHCYDLAKACARRDAPVKFAVSPVADRLVKHHRGFGGVSYVYVRDPGDIDRVRGTIEGLDGVEEALEREEAAARFRLMPSRIGDLVVLPDRNTVFGDLPQEVETLAPTYRTHGSLHEMDIPLLLHTADPGAFDTHAVAVNLDLTRLLFP